MAHEVLRETFGVSANGPTGWASEKAPCRRCGTGTQGRDKRGAIHGSCLDLELGEQLTAERFGGRTEVVEERYKTGGAP
ncbi:hypothetical protein ACQEVZ_60610 [Dactylosporangium sp. CA-152071]|uniref:hypothetical protein n=1 Tax=Dactylosporangium sp. CA-152071 TaxID=3239933 RepID=UPI003D93BF64